MAQCDSYYARLRASRRLRLPNSAAYWAPDPRNALRVNRGALLEARRNALHLRRALLQGTSGQLRTRMIRAELNGLVRDHLERAEDLMRGLDRAEALASTLPTHQDKDDDGAGDGTPASQDNPGVAPVPGAYTITIAPGDMGFTVEEDIRAEFLEGLYAQPTVWLPSYGTWFIHLTQTAMQRRVFPKELRGRANFQNSTSLKLIREVLQTAAGATRDVFTDVRHLSDTNAALCLLNAYHCSQTNAPLPTTYAGLLEDMHTKLGMLTQRLKRECNAGVRFAFTYHVQNAKQRETLAPLNRDTKYPPDFFNAHGLYTVLQASGALGYMTRAAHAPNQEDRADLTYRIAGAVFGQDVPPFMAYQWNLRVGLVALEMLLMAYLLLETAQISASAGRRLQLRELLGDRYQSPDGQNGVGQGGGGQGQGQGQGPQRTPSLFYARGDAFQFFAEHYITPTLQHDPQTPASSLLPGLVLLALESAELGRTRVANSRYVSLTGRKFNELFDVINQKYIYMDPDGMLRARTTLRMAVEDGLAALMTRAAPVAACQEMMRNQFGVADDYDAMYFLVLGCLPIAVAVV
ncbi:UL25 [Eptesicus fuscus gammaherpesvirus]|uniref:UL25 n=1 Tax=vespertilionid gammaherpesvirus 3 TaxID=2846598 RepID=A0A2D1A8R1_9GAMA|nr:UL25 [Eptesicus fuscus gammaherpesvirus]ATA58248.1 UL25 [Eptesicus fuscus gammaherpesvirus]WAH70899.1 tegument protein UL25 [Eptesicus fuscus gammaherpesvirus]